MDKRFERAANLYGEEKIKSLSGKTVAVFGIGGVGGYVCESLARSGVGRLILVDADTVDITNINRQIIALDSTVGRYKAEVMADRIRDINPNAEVIAINRFFKAADDFDFSGVDYVADCIDTISSKVELAVACRDLKIPEISAMGAGNKLDPTGFKVADIYKTKYCPLAKVMRKLLRERGIDRLKVVYSEEEPVKTQSRTPASNSFCPPAMGLVIASEIFSDLTSEVQDGL